MSTVRRQGKSKGVLRVSHASKPGHAKWTTLSRLGRQAARPASAGVQWGKCCLKKGTAREGVIWGQLNRLHKYNVFELAGAWPCSVLSACSHPLICSAGALQKQQREKLRAALAANDRVAHWLDTIRRQIEQGIEGADEKRVQLERVGRGHGSAVMSEPERAGGLLL